MNLLPDWRSLGMIWHPDWCHAPGSKQPFFEGWYFKLVDATGQNKLAIIPGYAWKDGQENRHAFIQVLDAVHHRSHYFTFPFESLTYASDRFSIQLGPNSFDRSGIRLDLRSNELQVQGEVSFGPWHPWPVHWNGPGAMGWYAFVPAMECYHGVLSFDHAIDGSLRMDRRPIELNGGRGYIEKDWGRSFPESWVWIQCNHFAVPDTSLMVSIAKIPWLGGAFTGFLVGWLFQGKFHPLTTYNGARLEVVTLNETSAHFHVRAGRFELQVQVEKDQGGTLRAPILGGMTGRVDEGLAGRAFCTWKDHMTGKTLFSGIGRHAGIEIHGNPWS